MSSLQPLLTSMEIAASVQPDIYDHAFERYFELCPESKELLRHADNLMLGRMMEQVMSLLMEEDVEDLEVYFRFEVGNHEGYGAQLPMYEHLFQACRDVVAKNCEGQWDADTDRSWSAQIDTLLRLVAKYSSTADAS